MNYKTKGKIKSFNKILFHRFVCNEKAEKYTAFQLRRRVRTVIYG